ncbi:unnamed protein product, partial [marine sediment metagenome]
GIFYDYIDLPRGNMTSGQSEISLEFWIKPDEWTSDNFIWDEYIDDYWQFSISCGKWYTRDNSTGTEGSRDNDLSLPSITEGEWHHMAFIYSVSQGIKSIYLDGEIYTSTNISIEKLTSERDRARIGYATEGEYYDGMLDEIRISHFANSPGWIATVYVNQLNPNDFYFIGDEECFDGQENFNISISTGWNLISLPSNKSMNMIDIVVNYLSSN